MNQIVGWALAAVATAVGYMQWGWRGVVLAVTIIAFWLLLQFGRAMRVLRSAGQGPIGQIDSAVMLHSKLARGMLLMQILPLTRSLGLRVADAPAEAFEWRDNSGACVRIEFLNGRCSSWQLSRPETADTPIR